MAAALVAMPAHAQQATTAGRTYVIVQGAWGSSSTWQTVDSMLTAQGHRVHRIPLTGLGQRLHLASPDIGLETHINDVVNAVLWDNLRDIVLVGYSYGGMVATGVAGRIPDRVGKLIYVDAILPEPGESVVDIMPESFVKSVRANTRNGFIVPAWQKDTVVVPRDVPQPLKTFTDSVRFDAVRVRAIPGTYILTYAEGGAPDAFERFAVRASKLGMHVVRIVGDHTPHRSQPKHLVELLVGK
jgi:pimeloyl-ACP methyl ester carboxylesterase